MDLKRINRENIRDFIRTSPILFSLAFTLLTVLSNETFSMLFRLLPDNTWRDILYDVLGILWPVALAVIFGFGFIFRKRGFRAAIGAALPVFLLYGIVLVSQVGIMADNPDTPWKSELEIFQGILMLLGIGIREEILFRGVIANAIVRKYGTTAKGLWITVLSAGAMFGAVHLANVLHGASFTGALVQAIGAAAGGVLYCAVYLRSGSIWGVALLHSLQDTPAYVTMLFTNASENLSAAAMISGYRMSPTQIMFIVCDLLLAAYLLRKSKQQKIFDRFQQA